MYDATKVFAVCPKGCEVRLIKCLPNEFICPKCKKVFTLIGEKLKHWKELKGALSFVAIEKCQKVLQSGHYKRIKSIRQATLGLDNKLNEHFSKRVRLLTEAGIETISDLVKKTAQELFEIERFGLGCVKEVEKFLAKHGLELGMTDEAISEYRQSSIIRPKEDKGFTDIVESGGDDNMIVALDKSMQAADTLSSSLHAQHFMQLQFKEKLTSQVIQLLDAVDPFVSKEKLIKEMQNGRGKSS